MLAQGSKGRKRSSLWIGFCSCLLILQKKPPRENDHKQISSSSSGSLSPSATVQSPKHEWKIIASEKTSSEYLRRQGSCLKMHLVLRTHHLLPSRVPFNISKQHFFLLMIH